MTETPATERVPLSYFADEIVNLHTEAVTAKGAAEEHMVEVGKRLSYLKADLKAEKRKWLDFVQKYLIPRGLDERTCQRYMARYRKSQKPTTVSDPKPTKARGVTIVVPASYERFADQLNALKGARKPAEVIAVLVQRAYFEQFPREVEQPQQEVA